jgi:5-methyltetrahydropteroyltriglutamate--homocysteine methyltransferase
VRPPLIYGDVVRPGPVTVEWARGAHARTRRPVKAILTGPVTLLRWSFAPDDRPPDETCAQIALAIRDETVDLETAGIRIVQLDEPALREGLPAHAEDVHAYLDWAVGSFRLASCGLRDDTQVHAHVCYADFDDFLDVLQSLDVDVLSVEAARSGMGLLGALNGGWRGGIGPGVHDVHAPGVPPTEEIVERLRRALAVLGPEQLWVNPDCGLKTRRWQEVVPALENMVEAAAIVRAELAGRWPAQPRRASGA